jgi:magnesium transporter
MTLLPTAPVDMDLRSLLHESGPESAASRLLALHPVEMAEALEPLDHEDRLAVFQQLPDSIAARLLLHVDAEFRAGVISQLPPGHLASLLSRLPADEAGALLAQLPSERAEAVLERMPAPAAQQLRSLQGYAPESVGRLMVHLIPRVMPHWTVEETLAHLRDTDGDLETINNLYIVDGSGRLIGVIALRELVVAPSNRRLDQVMQTRLIMVTPETDREQAANLISRYNLLALPVVDDERRLLGVVTVDDLIDVLIQEGTEDVLRMGGVGGHEGPLDATPYWAGRITAAVKKRFPWLVMLFLAETLTGSVLRHYDHELAHNVGLAFFIPLLLGTGGNTGSQSVTTIVRGLALGEIRLPDGLKVMVREASTGLLLGLLLGTVAFGRALLWHSPVQLAVTVALTVMVVSTWATTMGALVPLVAHRLRIDPTVVSAPFITTFVDATGLVIYFLIAKAMLGV